ncbi:hypothetical protein [Streptomyces tsukubensis]|uniref:Uncharacterized protein n=1 Tax=Streptomyces tsukubensis TaxID=83656 RepID=A0A1V4A635_9ACTN|nr:hypothetical protein [Streptomyces tsukubensis]OON76203.1 hypothetical protein B1H18_21515 [Streptomyces tsukubensis]QFR93726.1 hypothetical protein GBW32_12330 [Streptomyces tsukubensis]
MTTTPFTAPAFAGWREVTPGDRRAVWSVLHFDWPTVWELYLAEGKDHGTWITENWTDTDGLSHSVTHIKVLEKWYGLSDYFTNEVGPVTAFSGPGIATFDDSAEPPTPTPFKFDIYFLSQLTDPAKTDVYRLQQPGFAKTPKITSTALRTLFPWVSKPPFSTPFTITSVANLYTRTADSKWVAVIGTNDKNETQYVVCQTGSKQVSDPKRIDADGLDGRAAFGVPTITATTHLNDSPLYVLGSHPGTSAPDTLTPFTYSPQLVKGPLTTASTLTKSGAAQTYPEPQS